MFNGLLGLNNKSFGTCEFCHEYSSTLYLIKFHKDVEGEDLTERENEFYHYPFFACVPCRRSLVDKMNGAYYYNIPSSKIFHIGADYISKSGPFRNKLIREMSRFQNIFPEKINGIYVADSEEVVQSRFKDKLNVIVSFKYLSLLSYYSHVVVNRNECLLNFWNSRLTTRGRFFSDETSRILIALGMLHAKSEHIAIWIWSDLRIVSVELFTEIPARMIQFYPKKLLKVVS